MEPVDLTDLDAVEPWRKDAACREVDDPSIFFPGRGSSKATQAAKAICGRCLVRDECLNFAVRYGIGSGIFGGLGYRKRLELDAGVAASA